MKKIVLLFILFICIASCSFAHSGRTDGNGGHYNRSTGEYHYHHGYSAHQHYEDGSCPYEEGSSLETEEKVTGILQVNGSTENEEKEKLEELIRSKQTTIGRLNGLIVEKNKEVEELKNVQTFMWFGFVFIFLLGVFISYGIGKNRSSE